MLVKRCGRWVSIKSALGQRLAFAGDSRAFCSFTRWTFPYCQNNYIAMDGSMAIWWPVVTTLILDRRKFTVV